ncbi:hypothetical protein VPNG_07936 [Cytospora leucostoma]|uniref:F-box domain-containing protein n=1 Tax=Cytospora leucostoma TaxID=1230097 RepID=A0A423WAP3_9PEZI|nr:hypothetical protein VPNG_07936 [Cytospora leucostoma]
MATSQHTHTRSSRKILSLPDELLVEIFDAVKTYKPANGAQHASFASSPEDISNLRLVCRRFEACSSHLLVHYVRLDGINTESLERLEAISRHPTISKGVHIVRLVTRFYSPILANDIRRFAGYALNKVFVQAMRYREAFKEGEKEMETDGSLDVEQMYSRMRECAAVLEGVKAVLKTWGRMSLSEVEDVSGSDNPDYDKSDQEYMALKRSNSGIKDEAEEERHRQLLYLAHGLYRLRYQEQEKLRKDDAFIRRFAAAMARMPRAKGLEIHDFVDDWDAEEIGHAGDGSHGGDDYAGLIDIDTFTQPMSWDEATDRGLGDPPVELLFKLPVAIQGAGVRLDRISMQTSTCAELYYPLLRKASARDVLALGRAVSEMRLKNFIFLHQAKMRSRLRTTPAPEDVEAFGNLTSAMSNSSDLEQLWLRLDSGWADGGLDPARRISLGSVLLADPDSLGRWGQPSWNSLRDVHLSNLALHLSDLEHLAAQLRESNAKLEFLTLKSVHLLSGTWSEALDLLRTVEVEWEIEISEPSGAECEDVRMVLAGQYDAVFGRLDGSRSLAEDFVNHDMKQNPLTNSCGLEMEYSVDGQEVLIEVTVEDEPEDLPEDVDDVISQV